MNFSLEERYERLIESYIGSGRFDSPQAVVQAALDRLGDPLAAVSAERLNELVNEGVRDLDAGRIVTAEEMDRRYAARRAAFLARTATR